MRIDQMQIWYDDFDFGQKIMYILSFWHNCIITHAGTNFNSTYYQPIYTSLPILDEHSHYYLFSFSVSALFIRIN